MNPVNNQTGIGTDIAGLVRALGALVPSLSPTALLGMLAPAPVTPPTSLRVRWTSLQQIQSSLPDHLRVPWNHEFHTT